jgi:cytochrome c553
MKIYSLVPAAIAGVLFVAAATPQAAETGDPAAGKNKKSMCAGCHGISGYKAVFPEVYSVPKLGGQHAAYIVKAISDYKSGARKSPVMAPMVANLSTRDIEDLAAFYSSQRGLVTKY